MLQRFALGFVLIVELAAGSWLHADSVYTNLLNQEVEGRDVDVGPVLQVPVWSDEAVFDFNADGQDDALLRHGYEGSPFGLSRSAVDMLARAEVGLRQSQATLFDIRATILQAAEVPNDTVIPRLQQRIDSQVAAMCAIRRDTSYGGSVSFQHLSGRYPITATPETLDVLNAASTTQLGIYDITVLTPAERADVEAYSVQTSPLSSNERIYINGAFVELLEGMTQQQVVNAINAMSAETGVRADTLGTGGSTRLYSELFGSNAFVSTFSDRVASADSSGFLNESISSNGTDVIVSVDSRLFTGIGNQVEVSGGAAQGLTFRVPLNGSDVTKSKVGPLGQVEVIDDPLDARVMRRNRSAQVQSRPLLDGSAGRRLWASDTAIVPMRGSNDTVPGSYAIEVSTPAERASLEASVSQAGALSADEVLVVNGVSIPLPAGASQAHVIDIISGYQKQTGVFADAGGEGGSTRLYSEGFGVLSSVNVISTVAASERSSGFGIYLGSSAGVDVETIVGGNSWKGIGDTVRPIGGNERGLVFAVGPDPADPVRTYSGLLGILDVSEHPLAFPSGPDRQESFDVMLPNVAPESYGLDKLSVLSRLTLDYSLLLVDEAIDELSLELGKLEAITDAMPLGAGIAEIVGIDGMQLVSEDGYVIKLNENDVVGPELPFDDTGFIDASGLYPNSWDVGEGYLGIAIPDEGDFRFGWMRLEVGVNASVTIKDYALESEIGVPIWIGDTDRVLPLTGDFDSNGTVGFSDFLELSRVFGLETNQLRNQSPDLDRSGKVDFADFLRFSSLFPSARMAVVPEPNSLTMMTFVCVTLFGCSRGSGRRD